MIGPGARVPACPSPTRRYEYAAPLRQDAVDARVWSGIHFRFADVSGLDGGTTIADWALDHYFQPR
jgi:hypothetical protein